jgi:hypothetical protein
MEAKSQNTATSIGRPPTTQRAERAGIEAVSCLVASPSFSCLQLFDLTKRRRKKKGSRLLKNFLSFW